MADPLRALLPMLEDSTDLDNAVMVATARAALAELDWLEAARRVLPRGDHDALVQDVLRGAVRGASYGDLISAAANADRAYRTRDRADKELAAALNARMQAQARELERMEFARRAVLDWARMDPKAFMRALPPGALTHRWSLRTD